MMIRKHRFSRILLAGGLVLPLAQFAVGQQPRPGFGQAPQAPAAGVRQGNDPRGGSDANRGVQGGELGNQILRGSQIIGATVNLRAGSRFGTVNDFVFGDGGCVQYVIATYGNDFVPIPWGAAMWAPDQRVLTVDIDPGRIRDMPRFHQISELTNHQFSEKVQTFYRGTNGRGDMNQRGAQRQGATNHAPAANAPAGQPVGRPGAPAQGSSNRTGRNERNGDRR
jgi:hypothetical protein